MKLTPMNLGLLVAVLALGLVELLSGGGRAAEREIEKLFPLFTSDAAQRIEVAGPEGTLRLHRTDGAWVCSERFDYPAREDFTRKILNAMASLTTIDLLSTDAGSHKDYGLDQKTTRVRVWGEGDDLLVDLIQGKDVPDGLACYVKRFGGDEVYRAPVLTRIPSAQTIWLESRWFLFEPGFVRKIEVTGADLPTPVVIEREVGRSRWHKGDDNVALGRVDSFFAALQGLLVEDVVAGRADPEALGEVVLRVELTLADDSVLAAEFGAPMDSVVRARRDPGGFVVAIPEGRVTLMAQRALEF